MVAPMTTTDRPPAETVSMASAADATQIVSDRAHRLRWWALVVLTGSLLVITLDTTILNVAVPALVESLGASMGQLQWIIDGYALVFAGMLLTAGAIGDRFGRKGALQGGLVVFALASLGSTFADSATTLTVMRGLMGLGAAFIMPSTLSLLTNLFRDPRERGRAIGIWAAVGGASGALGPILGGLILRWFDWHAVFFINVPLIAALLLAGHYLLPTSRAPHARKLDPVGAGLSMIGLVTLLWGIIELPTGGFGDPSVTGALSIGLLVLAAFVVWELKCPNPMLDMRFFKNRRFSAANLAITLVYFAMFGQMFVMGQYMQVVLGYSALGAGLRTAPMSVVILAVAPMAPRLVEKVGTKMVVGVGLLIASAGVLWNSFIPVSNGYWHLLLGIMLISLGMGLTMAPATESIMGSLPPAKAGVGSAMNDTTRQMGGALGVAVLGSILTAIYRPHLFDSLTSVGAPSAVIDKAQESVGVAILGVAQSSELPAGLGEQVTQAAAQAYVDGVHVAMKFGALVLWIAAICVFAWLPARAEDVRDEESGPLDGLASATWAEAEGALEQATYEAQHGSAPEDDPAARGRA